MGNSVNSFVIKNFNLTEQNVAIIDDIYTLNYENEEDND
jgi:predicted amidophosphoribosyltransferase